MSRIHDALKRAEQEKVENGTLESADLAAKPAPPISEQGEGPQPLSTEKWVMAASPAMGEPSEGLALLKTIVERCPLRTWNPNRSALLFFDGQNHVVGTEEFRTLRSRLYLMREQQPLQSVLITSPLPREGKTFVAVNLARVIARQRDRRALLIDADLRLSRMHLLLGAPAAPGLSDYLSGNADEYAIIQRGPVDNLFFIAGGKPVSNPSELIGNGRLKRLLSRIGPAFDWIILDSPPAIPVSDAKVLAEACDGVLVLIRAGVTPFDLAQKACQGFRERRLLGVVLNGVSARSTYSSYYYYQKKDQKKK